VFVSVQVDSKATDPYAGGGFRLELEKRNESSSGAKLTGRVLFFQLLSQDEVTLLLGMQNRIIASLPQPPSSRVQAYPEFVRDQYLSYFRPQAEFDAIKCWLRYRDLADVTAWADVLGSLLPDLDERARRTLKADQMYLGRGAIELGLT
jgi:hypothetical protein